MANGTVSGHEQVGGATKRGAPDTSVVIPTAVKAAADRANELSKQAKDARDAKPPDHELPLAASLKPPPERPPSTTVVTADFDPKNPNPPRDIAPPMNPQAPEPSAEELKHQFSSLRGRFEREAEEKRNLARQLNDTQRLLAQLSTAPAGASAEGSGVRFSLAAPPPPGRRVTEKERSEYGDELLDVVARRAQEVYEPMLAQLTSELNNIKQQVGGVKNTVAFDARVKMYEDLAKEVPHWDNINNSAEFAQWLDQPDPISGAIRRGLLNAAHNSNVTGRVVAIFKGFLADLALRNPAYNSGQANPQPGNGAGRSPPQVDLAQFAAPGRAKPGQTQVPPEKPIFNASDIPQFYRDKIAGKFAGREAEAEALERALLQAGNEGRLRR